MVLLEVSINFCADSPPRAVRWEWGTMVLLEVSISFCADSPPQGVKPASASGQMGVGNYGST